jgi:hypothetical protein
MYAFICGKPVDNYYEEAQIMLGLVYKKLWISD